MQYASKPSIIEAVQWTGNNFDEVRAFAPEKLLIDFEGDDEQATGLRLQAGKDGAQEWVPVPVGHWLVNQPDDKSDIWPVDPDYFAAKYIEREPEEYTLADFRAFGLLWLINKAVFHPRGFAVGIDDESNTWVMLGDGTEPWMMWSIEAHDIAVEAGADPEKLPPYPIDEDDAFMRVEVFLGLHQPVPEEDETAIT